MATNRAHGSFVPFTLPLGDDGHVCISEDLFSLRFDLWIGTMYVEQEMHNVDSDISKTILMQDNKTEDEYIWILGLGLLRVKELSNSHIQAPMSF